MAEAEDIPFDEDDHDDRDTSWTLASSAHDLRFENGRHYSGRGNHPMPNDELNAENERVAHHMYLLMLHDKLWLAPIQNPRKVVDLGSGTGLWAKDVADAFPDCQVLGLDLNPNNEFTPPNCELRVEDIRGEWLPDNTDFDFVHIRSLFGFEDDDWPQLYRQISANLAPGGYVEQIELEIKPLSGDNTLPSNNPLQRLADVTADMSRKTGRLFNPSSSMRSLMEGAGLVDFTEKRYKVPLGQWSSEPYFRELGAALEMYFKTGIQGWLLQTLTNNMGWTLEDVNQVVADAFHTVDARQEHIYYEIVLAYARKPLQ